MANLQGYTQASVSDILDHYTRHDGDENQARHTYQNQNIDPKKTRLNRMLSFDGNTVSWNKVEAGGKANAMTTLDGRVSAVDRKPGKNTNVLSDWVLTLPRRPEFDMDDAARAAGFDGAEAARHAFFDEAFLYLSAAVGRENVIGAWIHLDETRPHMHFAFAPVTTEPGSTTKGAPLYWSEKDARKYSSKVWTKEEAEKFKGRVWTEADARNFPSAPIEIGSPRCVAGMPKCVAGMPKLDSKCSPRFGRTKKKEAKPVLRFAQSAKFDQDALRTFHDALAAHMNSSLGFDAGITIDGDDELSKLDRSLSHIKDQRAYGRAKQTVDVLRGEAKAARSEVLLAGEGLKSIEKHIEDEQRRLERLRRAREAAEKRVARLEAIHSECRAADDAPVGAKGRRFDQIANRCAEWLTELKEAVARTARAAASKLGINLRGNSADAGTAAANRSADHGQPHRIDRDRTLVIQPEPNRRGHSRHL